MKLLRHCRRHTTITPLSSDVAIAIRPSLVFLPPFRRRRWLAEFFTVYAISFWFIDLRFFFFIFSIFISPDYVAFVYVIVLIIDVSSSSSPHAGRLLRSLSPVTFRFALTPFRSPSRWLSIR